MDKAGTNLDSLHIQGKYFDIAKQNFFVLQVNCRGVTLLSGACLPLGIPLMTKTCPCPSMLLEIFQNCLR